MTNCEFCPLKSGDCFTHATGAYHYCNKLNPNHPDYNPKYLTSIQRRNNLLPSVIQTIKNVGSAVIRNAVNSFGVVPEEIRKERLSICEGCPKLLAENRRCSVCSCFVDYKIQLAAESCPESKWAAYSAQSTQTNAAGCGCKGT